MAATRAESVLFKNAAYCKNAGPSDSCGEPKEQWRRGQLEARQGSLIRKTTFLAGGRQFLVARVQPPDAELANRIPKTDRGYKRAMGEFPQRHSWQRALA